MSDTPRTDALLLEINEGRIYETVGPVTELACTLERELAEAHRVISETVKWVPITEKLPRDKEWVGIPAVLATDGKAVFITQTHPSWWNLKDARGPEFDGPKITHWMPLPEAPK